MPIKTYHGRLVCDGEGNLFGHEDPAKDALDDEGTPTLKPVAYDRETDSYIFIDKGAPSHNDRHHQRFATFSGTTGPLYDAEGKMVFTGDAHHYSVQHDDAHFNPDAPNKTELLWDDDDPSKHLGREIPTTETMHLPQDEWECEPEQGDPTVTGHTDAEAYRV